MVTMGTMVTMEMQNAYMQGYIVYIVTIVPIVSKVIYLNFP